MKVTKYPLLRAATELGVNRETLRRALHAARVTHGGPYTLAEIVKAMAPDEKFARARLMNADAAFREHELEELKDELVRMADVEKLVVDTVVLPMRQWLLSFPSTYDVRCNSENPQIARAALTQARDECMGLLRDKLPKIKSEA